MLARNEKLKEEKYKERKIKKTWKKENKIMKKKYGENLKNVLDLNLLTKWKLQAYVR